MNLAILALVEQERTDQDKKWGGKSHDEQHTMSEWQDFVLTQIDKINNNLDEPNAVAVERNWIKIAALAFAVLENYPRHPETTELLL